MKDKTKTWLLLLPLVLVAVGFGAGYLFRNALLRHCDAIRLARFVQQVAAADRVVGTCLEDGSVRLTLTGEAAKNAVRAVASAASARMPDAEFACAYDASATFYRGTNVLGQVRLSCALFLLETNEPPFHSEALEAAVYTPLRAALHESYGRKAK